MIERAGQYAFVARSEFEQPIGSIVDRNFIVERKRGCAPCQALAVDNGGRDEFRMRHCFVSGQSTKLRTSPSLQISKTLDGAHRTPCHHTVRREATARSWTRSIIAIPLDR
jgi:hypothetical protein